MTFLLTGDGEGLTDGEDTLQSRYQVLSSQLPDGGEGDMTSHLSTTLYTNSDKPPSSPLMTVSSEQGEYKCSNC